MVAQLKPNNFERRQGSRVIRSISIGLEFAWQIATAESLRSRYEFVEPGHFFIGVCKVARAARQGIEWNELALPHEIAESLKDESTTLDALGVRFNLNYQALLGEMRERIERADEIREAQAQRDLSRTSRVVFKRAAELAVSAQAINTLHLFCALLENEASPPVAILKDNGVNVAALKSALETMSREALTTLAPAALNSGASVVRVQLNPSTDAPQQQTPLLRFGKDLTRLAREGAIKECLGRRGELLQMVRALDRETKNNPLLVGEPGVGKTAIVEGLAWRIVHNRSLPARRLVQIQAASLVAGTKYRGEFEERLQTILNEAAHSPDVILFIDEIHSLIGAGDRTGALDAANIMKPALARGELRCIGATTPAEYRKFIEKDPAFERRFQPIFIHELSSEKTLELLKECYGPRLAERHRLTIGTAALEAAVRLSVRYLPERRLPDKAIDLLEDACARITTPALSAEAIDTAAASVRIVTAETITKALSEKTGVLVGQMAEDEDREKRERVLSMADELKARIVGQDKACDKVARLVQRALSGLKTAERPVGVLLFLGPTGTGKTALATATAAFLSSLFGEGQRLLRLDMSEYKDRHSLSRLVGSPPGYTGHEEEGQLTRALRRPTYSVVLLDEIEKAHPDVLNLFLQLFDEGRLTDSSGRTVNAAHALFIMTSNVCVKVIKGFTPPDRSTQSEALFKELGQEFSSEFLNRMDDVIVFHPHTHESLQRIARLMLSSLENRLAEMDMSLEVSAEALAWLSRESCNEIYGARPLRRMIERQVENEIAGMILRDEVKAGHVIYVNATGEGLTFEQKEKSPL